jgi:hypothetical protein
MALVAIAAVGVPSASAAASPPQFACDPPLPRDPSNCSIWHNSPVTLVWRWGINEDPSTAVAGSDCSTPHVFKADTAGTKVMCAVRDVTSGDIASDTATIRLDQTPPTVTGFTPDRPPDYNGWWNHPVTLTFTGADATSGILTCDSVAYSGPNVQGGPVSGGCSDAAGNSATGTFAINYDSTPPALAALPSSALRGRNIINWSVGSDAVETRILRSPGIGTAPVSEVYVGSGHTFADPVVKGGTKYTYAVSAADAAGNVASITIAVTAAAIPEAVPSVKFNGLPRLHWRRVSGADYYNVQLYRGGRKILSSWPRRSQVQLQRRWTYGGHPFRLTPGLYHWYAWPGFGQRSKHRYGKLITDKYFKVAKPANKSSR